MLTGKTWLVIWDILLHKISPFVMIRPFWIIISDVKYNLLHIWGFEKQNKTFVYSKLGCSTPESCITRLIVKDLQHTFLSEHTYMNKQNTPSRTFQLETGIWDTFNGSCEFKLAVFNCENGLISRKHNQTMMVSNVNYAKHKQTLSYFLSIVVKAVFDIYDMFWGTALFPFSFS